MRHRLTFAVAAILVVGTAVEGALPTLAQFMRIRAPGSPTLVPRHALYFVDWPDGINQLYRRQAGSQPDAPFERLTDFADGLSRYDVSPDARTVIVAAARGGSEQNDLYRLDSASGDLTPLYEDAAVVYTHQRWRRDSQAFFFTANDVSPADFHIYRHDLATGLAIAVLQEPGYWIVSDVSDDGDRLLLTRYTSVAHADAFELNTRTGRLASLNVADDAFNRSGGYLAGDEQVTIACDMEDGIRRLFVRDLESGVATKALPDLDPYPFEEFVANETRTLAVLIVNADGYRTPHLVRLPGFQPLPWPDMDKGVVNDVGLRGRYVTFSLSTARNPGISYTFQASVEPRPQPLTVADAHGIDLAAFTLPEFIRYPSFDGREIPAFLSTPPGYRAGTPIPFVVMFHGGPESQSRPSFDRTIQYLLSRGYGVLQPNVRGSTGYGRAFHQLDNGPLRWDAVRDGVAAGRWLVTEGYATAGRIAAYGRSYGGFMSVASVIEGPDVFGASIDIVGVVNFETFLRQTKSYRRHLREAEYGSLDDPEMLASISPIHRIDEIKVPMLIAHGLNDPRVPVGEAMQLAVGLQRRGYDPELLFFPDEGHNFAKLENRMLFFQRAASFLDRTIGIGR